MKSEKNRANHENAQPLKNYPTILLLLSLATLRRRAEHALPHDPHKARSFRPPPNNRDGTEAPRPGTASPLKIFALARCTQHDTAAYHLRISSEGSSSRCAALRLASLRMRAAVSFAMKPCLSNASARKSNGCSLRPVLRSNTGC